MNKNVTWTRILERQFNEIINNRVDRSNQVEFVPMAQRDISVGYTTQVYSTYSRQENKYNVTITPYFSSCTCPDHVYRMVACKHMVAFAKHLDDIKLKANTDAMMVTVIRNNTRGAGTEVITGPMPIKPMPIKDAIAILEKDPGNVVLVAGTALPMKAVTKEITWEIT